MDKDGKFYPTDEVDSAELAKGLKKISEEIETRLRLQKEQRQIPILCETESKNSKYKVNNLNQKPPNLTITNQALERGFFENTKYA